MNKELLVTLNVQDENAGNLIEVGGTALVVIQELREDNKEVIDKILKHSGESTFILEINEKEIKKIN